jgi:outer membrane receptor protein involved in Fe transport
MLSAGAQLTWAADVHYQTQALTDFNAGNYPTLDPTYIQKAYAISDSSLTYAAANGKLSITLYGKNLADKLYKVTVYNQGPPATAYVNDPRTYGVMISGKL